MAPAGPGEIGSGSDWDLELTVFNLTTDPYEYYINQVFFNAVEGISLTENTLHGGWNIFDEVGYFPSKSNLKPKTTS